MINFIKICLYVYALPRWRRGVAVECRSCDQEVVGSSLGWVPRCKNSGQVSHTYVPLSPSSITWYWPKGGDHDKYGYLYLTYALPGPHDTDDIFKVMGLKVKVAVNILSTF